MRWLLGIDEAGRGPLAGPVSVGVVAVEKGFEVAKEFVGVADSKKLTEKKREEIFSVLEARATKGDLRFAVEFASAHMIDAEGIVPSVRSALNRGVDRLNLDSTLVHIQLDGALRAPSRYSQETIINGDELVPIISLASIAAKVLRDRHMIEMAKLYPLYEFHKHKGYGTKQHYEMLQIHGLCAIHRRSFIHLDPTKR